MPDLNSGALAAVVEEQTFAGLPVTGALPSGLVGTLLRNGPNPFSGRFTGSDVIDWWPEAAMLHALDFSASGEVGYRNRWARTQGWAEFQRRAGENGSEPAQNLAQEPVKDHASDQSAAAYPATNPNVNVIQYAGEVLALAEGGAPLAVTRTLQSVADSALQAEFAAGMTAHPKLDPITGELRSFRSHWEAPFLTYQVNDRVGKRIHSSTIAVAAPSMLHDFAITQNYSLWLDTNVGYDFQLFAKGMRIPLCWEPDRGSRIGVIPRFGGEVTWLTVADCFVQHVINAFEADQATLILDVMRYPEYFVLNATSDGYEPNPLAVPWRYTIDLRAGTVTEAALCVDPLLAMELPRINESLTGRAYRYSWAVLQPSNDAMRGIACLDTHTGTVTTHAIEPGDQNSEPVFVPDPSRSGEDGGWLLTCVYRHSSDTTDVLVLDAANLEAQPLATVHLPVRVPAGFHGAWIRPE